MKLVEFVQEARKEITLNVFEGTLSEADAALKLDGILTVVKVAQHDSKSEKLKSELVAVEAAIVGTIQKLTGAVA